MSSAISKCKDTTFFQTGKIFFLMSDVISLWQRLLHDIQVELTGEIKHPTINVRHVICVINEGNGSVETFDF